MADALPLRVAGEFVVADSASEVSERESRVIGLARSSYDCCCHARWHKHSDSVSCVHNTCTVRWHARSFGCKADGWPPRAGDGWSGLRSLPSLAAVGRACVCYGDASDHARTHAPACRAVGTHDWHTSGVSGHWLLVIIGPCLSDVCEARQPPRPVREW